MTAGSPNGTLPDPAWLDGPWPADAPPDVAEMYGAVGRTMRVPVVNSAWRALAAPPGWLGQVWPALRPVMRTAAFERAARRLREAALIEEAASLPSHKAFRGDLVRVEIDWEMRDRIANFNAVAHYALAKTMLAMAWLRLSLDGDLPGGAAGAAVVPEELAAGAFPVPPLAGAELRGKARDLLAELTPAHGHAVPDDYFRSIGRATDYLGAAWNALKAIVRDEPYDERATRLAEQAAAAAGELVSRPPAVALADDDRRRLAAVLRYYTTRHLPDLLIDVAFLRALTDGPDAARSNPYDLPDDGAA